MLPQRCCRKTTPSMEAHVTDHVWEIEEVVALLERREAGLPLVADPKS